MTAAQPVVGRKDFPMAKYINGLEVDAKVTRKVVTENETVKYYPKFYGNPDPDKIDIDEPVIYDGGSAKGW